MDILGYFRLSNPSPPKLLPAHIFLNSRPLCMCAVSQSCLTLCNPMDCSPPGSSVHGISQARVLEWAAMPTSRGSSRPRDRTCVSCSGRWILHSSRLWELHSQCAFCQDISPPDIHFLPLETCGIEYVFMSMWASLAAQLVKNLPAMRETWVQGLGWEDPLEKGKATHCSILAWRSPWGCKESDTTERLSLSCLCRTCFSSSVQSI